MRTSALVLLTASCAMNTFQGPKITPTGSSRFGGGGSVVALDGDLSKLAYFPSIWYRYGWTDNAELGGSVAIFSKRPDTGGSNISIITIQPYLKLRGPQLFGLSTAGLVEVGAGTGKIFNYQYSGSDTASSIYFGDVGAILGRPLGPLYVYAPIRYSVGTVPGVASGGFASAGLGLEVPFGAHAIVGEADYHYALTRSAASVGLGFTF